MNKKEFYKIQSEAFKDYAQKFSGGTSLLSLYTKWARSKDIYGIDRHQIWLQVRNLTPTKTLKIRRGTDMHYRLSSFLDYIHKIDMANLEEVLKKQEGAK